MKLFKIIVALNNLLYILQKYKYKQEYMFQMKVFFFFIQSYKITLAYKSYTCKSVSYQ